MRVSRRASSSRSRSSPSASPSASVGWCESAASPTTSGSEEVSATTVGVPQAIASRGGSPNPSYSDGKAKTSAALYRAGKSFGSGPDKMDQLADGLDSAYRAAHTDHAHHPGEAGVILMTATRWTEEPQRCPRLGLTRTAVARRGAPAQGRCPPGLQPARYPAPRHRA